MNKTRNTQYQHIAERIWLLWQPPRIEFRLLSLCDYFRMIDKLSVIITHANFLARIFFLHLILNFNKTFFDNILCNWQMIIVIIKIYMVIRNDIHNIPAILYYWDWCFANYTHKIYTRYQFPHRATPIPMHVTSVHMHSDTGAVRYWLCASTWISMYLCLWLSVCVFEISARFNRNVYGGCCSAVFR